MISTTYYRYDGYKYACCDSYSVVKRTLKGVWISLGWGSKDKFILNGARKRWAYPTKEEALESFRIRKRRQIMHCNDMIDNANQGLIKVGLKAIERGTRFTKYDDDMENWI